MQNFDVKEILAALAQSVVWALVSIAFRKVNFTLAVFFFFFF